MRSNQPRATPSLRSGWRRVESRIEPHRNVPRVAGHPWPRPKGAVRGPRVDRAASTGGAAMTPSAAPAPAVGSAWAVALAGAVSLAVAMGIGRFAFTPLLPMMLHDGLIDLPGSSWLASANYLGYLAGALLCMLQPWIWARTRWAAVDGPTALRGGLVATGLLTLAMAVPLPVAWPWLRFAAGVASAVVFVYTSGWCLTELAWRHASAMGGVMYAGPGIGIVVSGVFASAMVQWQWHARAGWLIFGVLALVLTALVWPRYRHGAAPRGGAPAAAPPRPFGAPPRTVEMAWLAAAYGLAGFGYIVTATFLPVIARTALPGSPWLDLFWPLFGLGVVVGAMLSTRLRISGDLRWLLCAGYVLQAAAIAVSLVSPSLTGFAVGSVMLGVPFTAITFFAMQEVRRLRPTMSASFMGLLTATYGVGQIVGPPLAAALLRQAGSVGAGFTLSLKVAIGALLLGAVIYAVMSRAYPMRRA